MSRHIFNYSVGEFNPPSLHALSLPVKSVQSHRRRDTVPCRCRCTWSDGCGAATGNEFDAVSIATSCVSHVDRLMIRGLPITTRTTTQTTHSYENGQSTAALGNCFIFREIILRLTIDNFPAVKLYLTLEKKMLMYDLGTF